MASIYGTLGIGAFIGFLAGLGLVGLVGLIRDYFLNRDLNHNLNQTSPEGPETLTGRWKEKRA